MSLSPVAESFDAAADCYDGAVNPLLRLEERFLPGILPQIRGKNVVDIGCGTGRWLVRLCDEHPASLVGIDPSHAMLAAARRKLPEMSLCCGTARELPLPDNSVDLILLSFALSYCDDLQAVVREIARVATATASIMISDMHPETERALSWKRTFPQPEGSVTMATKSRPLEAIQAAFHSLGFERTCHLDLPFGIPEREIFERAGKLGAYHAAKELPAIYISRFDRGISSRSPDLRLAGARIAFGPNACTPATLEIDAGRIASASVSPDREVKYGEWIDLSGCLVLPGLINAHDHLEFGLFPNLGTGPYSNSAEWAEDIHRTRADVIALHSAVAKQVRLYWGALRNLLSGVTTVCHHNPASAAFDNPDFPVRMVRELDWAHSLSFEPNLGKKFKESDTSRPFVLHVCEGTDRDTAAELFRLDRMGLLDERTVGVHGVGCTPEDAELLNQRGAGLIVCPSSNVFLFGRSISHDSRSKVHRVAIGTDSPLTAGGDLLDELRLARDLLCLSEEKLYGMCTNASASLLRLFSGQGRILPEGVADLLVVRDHGQSPAETLLDLSLEEIELVLIGGRVHLASASGLQRIPQEMRDDLSPLLVDELQVWVNAPVAWMFAEARKVLGPQIVLGGKRVAHVG